MVKARIQALLWAQRHLLLAMLIAFSVGVLLTSLWGAYGHYQMNALTKENVLIEEQKKALIRDKAELSVNVNVLKASNEGLRRSLQEQELRMNEQERALDFYRQLMDPASIQKGLVLNSYATTSRGNNRYQIKLVFVQYAKLRSIMRATVKIHVKGAINNVPHSIDLSENLSVQEKKALKLKFQYFQSLTQTVELPEGFEPELLEVRATINNKKVVNWQLEVPWLIEEI